MCGGRQNLAAIIPRNFNIQYWMGSIVEFQKLNQRFLAKVETRRKSIYRHWLRQWLPSSHEAAAAASLGQGQASQGRPRAVVGKILLQCGTSSWIKNMACRITHSLFLWRPFSAANRYKPHQEVELCGDMVAECLLVGVMWVMKFLTSKCKIS